MALPDITPVRQAALLLHGLSPGARERILAKLDLSEATQLRGLLKELADLGVPRAPSLKLQQLAAELPPRSTVSADRALSVHEQLDTLRPELVVHCLKRCAAVTVAQLLRAHDWSWKQQVLDRLSELRRAEVLRHMAAGALPMASAVLAALCQRLRAEAEAARMHIEPAVTEPVEAREPWWQSIMPAPLRRFPGWIR